MKTYAEKLKSPQWQRKRLEILSRDNFKCRSCGVTEKSLHVHHSFYEKGKDPWEYESASLTAQCEGCHQKIEGLILDIRKAAGGDLPMLQQLAKVAGVPSRKPIGYAESQIAEFERIRAEMHRADCIRRGVKPPMTGEEFEALFNAGKL